MRNPKKKTTSPMARVRASVGEIQSRGERVIGQLRRDAQSLFSRTRAEVMREVRDLERRMLRTLHGATEARVGRLERRIAKLEDAMAELRRQTERAA